MKLLINKDSNGAQELEELTGAYYRNNDFPRIKTDWELSQDDITAIVGKAVMERALEHYYSGDYLPEGDDGSGDNTDNDLVRYLQIPIAFKATFKYYQSNIVSHEDQGRKIKVDSANEKLPWEWMLDRDDLAHIDKIHKTTDRVLKFLEENEITEWMSSPNRTAARKLFVNSEAIFHEAYPIDMSPGFYYTVTPFIREVQTRIIKKALGDTYYKNLVSYWLEHTQIVTGSGSWDGSGSWGSGLPGYPEQNEFYDDLLAFVQKVIPLFTMVIAVKRLSLQVLPTGVVQQVKSMMQTANSSQAPVMDIIKLFAHNIQLEADHQLDDIKLILQAADPEANNYRLIPKNCETNKFFRT